MERVIEIDNNDELYINMLMEHKLASKTYLDDMYNSLKLFLWRIFSSDRDAAYRRLQHYIAKQHDTHLSEFHNFHNSRLYKVFRKFNIGNKN